MQQTYEYAAQVFLSGIQESIEDQSIAIKIKDGTWIQSFYKVIEEPVIINTQEQNQETIQDYMHHICLFFANQIGQKKDIIYQAKKNEGYQKISVKRGIRYRVLNTFQEFLKEKVKRTENIWIVIMYITALKMGSVYPLDVIEILYQIFLANIRIQYGHHQESVKPITVHFGQIHRNALEELTITHNAIQEGMEISEKEKIEWKLIIPFTGSNTLEKIILMYRASQDYKEESDNHNNRLKFVTDSLKRYYTICNEPIEV